MIMSMASITLSSARCNFPITIRLPVHIYGINNIQSPTKAVPFIYRISIVIRAAVIEASAMGIALA